MKNLSRAEIPEGYEYYRSHSKAFFDSIFRSESASSVRVEEDGSHGIIRHYFSGFFSIALFEKCDIEPTRELLGKYGMRRGLIFWSGWRKSRPETRGFLRIGYLISRWYHHSTRSAFSVLDTPEYAKKWSSNARGHRNKILREIAEGTISIDTEASIEDFLEVYRKTKIRHGWKRYLIWRQKYLSKYHSANIRIYMASLDGVILAGAVYLDDHPTSTYLIAFQDDAGKRHHLGLALIDRWFSESEKLGYRYLDLDHMRDTLDPPSYAGYTKFKSEIADYELQFREVWVKMMIC